MASVCSRCLLAIQSLYQTMAAALQGGQVFVELFHLCSVLRQIMLHPLLPALSHRRKNGTGSL